MKKVLATILALVMALSVTTAAWADETTLPQAGEDGVITLTGNTTIDSTAVHVTTGQTTVIDLNGHNLTINYAANAGSTQFSGAGTVLTFRDSKSTGFSNEGRWQGGILTLQGDRFTNIANPAFVPSIGATLNIDGVYVKCDGTGFLPLGNAAAVSVTNSFVEAKAYCVGTNSATVENSGVVITLKSSTFVTHNEDKDNCPVMINVAGKLNIDDCYICGQRQGVIVRAGEANITNSGIAIDDSVRYEGSEDYSAIDWGSGNNLPSAAIVVGNKTISKTGYKADAVVVFTDSSAYGGGTAAISGGTVTGAVTNSGSGSITVTGGNFTTADVEEFVDPDQTVILTLDANGGSCAVKTLAAASGAAVGELPVPTRTGYTFAGWFTAASGGTQVTGESVFDANATLYAHWTASDDSDGGSGSPSGEYLITVDRVAGGTVRVNPGRADKGDTVTITVTPKAGYELDELTVTDSKGSEINVRSAGSNKYTFEMPGSRVTVSASFARTGESGSDMPFTDVSAGAYYFDAVRWAAEEGITSGVTGTAFAPGRSCTRAQIVTFLWRANGSPRAENTKNPFTDVSADAYYYDAVLWAVEEGITSGVTGTTFAPDASCTRAQAAVMLWRAEGSPVVSGTNPFRDVADDDYYADAVVWAVKNGVTQGTTAATFEPGEACTRAQIVTFLYRALG